VPDSKIPPEIREDLAAVLSAVLGHPHVHKALLETGPTGETVRDAAKRLEQALGESWESAPVAIKDGTIYLPGPFSYSLTPVQIRDIVNQVQAGLLQQAKRGRMTSISLPGTT
jgi:hypothetical protein